MIAVRKGLNVFPRYAGGNEAPSYQYEYPLKTVIPIPIKKQGPEANDASLG